MKKPFLLVICFYLLSSFGSFGWAADTVETTGSVLGVLLPAAAYAMTVGLDDEEGRYQFYKAFLSTVGVTYGLNAVIDKEPPDGHGDSAFPSGHSAISFLRASFIYRRYGLTYGAWAYAGAALVAWSRVEADKHDVTDVCAGALLGIGGTWLFTKPLKKNISVTPLVSDHKIGITLTSIW